MGPALFAGYRYEKSSLGSPMRLPFFAGADAEKGIQRAGAGDRGKNKYGRKEPGDDAPKTRNDMHAGQGQQDDGQDDADDHIGGGYILFHMLFFIW
jgi:hypothetical protein